MIKKNPSLPSMKRKIPGFEMAFIEQFYLMAIIRWLLKVQRSPRSGAKINHWCKNSPVDFCRSEVE